jgi:hypothetical protein
MTETLGDALPKEMARVHIGPLPIFHRIIKGLANEIDASRNYAQGL